MKRTLAVCVATCRRPAGLSRLLECLALQQPVEGVRYELRIADNDPAASARELVQSALAGFPWTIRYVHEPVPNVARARNATLSVGPPVDLVAFVDDDEEAAPDWLRRLVEALDSGDYDAVFGPVERRLPAETPGWIARGDFFRLAAPQGDVDWRGARTGNALVRGAWLYARGFRFDESFGRSGGEDAHLFARLGEAGARMGSAPAARVAEEVEPDRLALRYLVRRGWRQGIAYSRVRGALPAVAHHPALSTLRRASEGSLHLARAAVGLGERRVEAARGLARLALAGGGLAGWLAPALSTGALGSYSAS